MNTVRISVVLPTRNPHRGRLAEVLGALEQQTLQSEQWEFCLIDNGSTPPLDPVALRLPHASGRIVREECPGLIAARVRGIAETRGELIVFLDDDTVPDGNFLAAAVAFMDAHPHVGTAGGKIVGRFETPPPDWLEHALWCLGLRNNGPEPREWSLGEGAFPYWTPIGAGLLTRRAALVPSYVDHVATQRHAIERNSWRGQGCGGVEDKDLVLQCLRTGWSTAYCPDLILTHLIPNSRLDRAYLERMIPELDRMWMRTLHAHGLDIFPPIHPATRMLRLAKAWFVIRPWRSPTARFQWLSTCGRLRGLADNHGSRTRYPPPCLA